MKAKDKKNNIAIWKIDTTLDIFEDKSTEQIIESIKLGSRKELEDVPLSVSEYEGKKIRIFQKQRSSEGWAKFLDKLLSEEITQQKKESFFTTTNKDLVLFIYDTEDIYAITSGGGYHIIDGYINERFPFEVAKRMLTGDFKSAEMRDLTGTVYSQSRNFRRSYSFSRRESFGKVWKKLTGNIDVSVLENSSHLIDFIQAGKRKRFNADIKSSFTFRKSITIDQVIGIVKEIQELLKIEPTAHQKETFGFLDTLKEVVGKKAKEELRDALLSEIYNFIKSTKQDCDFDFCHPKEMTKFLHGVNFKIHHNVVWPEEAPSASDVLIKLRQSDDSIIDKTNFESFKERFTKMPMNFQEDEDGDVIGESLWKYFHGEIKVGGKTYFFIDGHWYEIVGNFLNRLAEDFEKVAFGDKNILSKDIPFIEWTSVKEGEYNKNQAKEENFYFGDQVFLKNSEKGKIELFDLLYVKDGKTYIIQVKDGFGASTRDACSQIQMSAEIIEKNLSTNKSEELNGFFQDFKTLNPSVTKEKFFKILRNDRYYVLAFATPSEFNRENFIAKKFPSEIARFEVLGLFHEFKANGNEFIISHIKKTN
jgi:uncharacterized protein (TIGR04141 family)